MAAVVSYDYGPCNALTDLRHDLERESYELPRGFHAKNDPKPRRHRVLKCLKGMPIEIHVIAIRKESIYLHLRSSESWLYGFTFKKIVDLLLSTFLEIETRRKRLVLPVYSSGLLKRQTADVCRNTILESYANVFEIAVWETSSHAGLQIADYCSWAIQRKLERDDGTALNEIKSQIRSACSPWGVKLDL